MESTDNTQLSDMSGMTHGGEKKQGEGRGQTDKVQTVLNIRRRYPGDILEKAEDVWEDRHQISGAGDYQAMEAICTQSQGPYLSAGCIKGQQVLVNRESEGNDEVGGEGGGAVQEGP